ncbi:hypothetical protein [Streptomyces axinellae]|uniref:Uncharacterized protein n=1 Tax=Streptomyces axinellae TaxID=552788 RepID=A0ABN3PY08_9ACTN
MPEPTDPQRAFDPRQLAREMLTYDLNGGEQVRREQARAQVDADARTAAGLQQEEFRSEIRRQQDGLRRYEAQVPQTRADGQLAERLQQEEFDARVAEQVRVNASMARDLSPDQVEQDDQRERFLGAGAAGRTRQSGVVASAIRTLWQYLRRNRKTEKEQASEGLGESEPLLPQQQFAPQDRGFQQSAQLAPPPPDFAPQQGFVPRPDLGMPPDSVQQQFALQEPPPAYERLGEHASYREALGYEAAPQEFGLPPQVLAEPQQRYEAQPQDFGLPPQFAPQQTPYQRYDALGPTEKTAVENAMLDMVGKNPIYKQAYAENRLPTAGPVAGEAQIRQLAEEQRKVSGIAAAARASQSQAGPLQARPRPSAPGTRIPAPVQTNTQAKARGMGK